ncbi:MAG: pilin [Candidatus Nanoarchaeia archaeon]
MEVPLIGGHTSVSGPADYIRLAFIFGLGLVGITALFALVFGGIRYITSADSETKITDAKAWLTGAILGLVLLLGSYLILKTINPDLIILQEPTLIPIEIEPPVPIPTPAQPWPGIPGAHPETLTFSKSIDEQHFNERAPNSLRQALAGLPFGVLITSYDTGNHVSNSQHYLGNAVDIYVGNLSRDQIKQLLEYLYNLPQTNQILYGGMPEYNKINGQQYLNPKYNNSHLNHIHFAVFPY